MANKRIKKTIKPALCILLGCALMYVLFSSFMSAISKQDDLNTVQKEVTAVRAEKAKLQNEVELLQDDNYVTRYARENYVFTREGEKVAILPDNESSK